MDKIVCMGIVAIILLIGLPFWLNGCLYDRVVIDQYVEIQSVLTDEYEVSTYVGIHRNGDYIIERGFIQYNVKCGNIPQVKKRQMDMAIEIKQRVKEKLKTFEECEYD